MSWDFIGRRHLSVKDYVVSIESGRLLVWRNKTDEKLDVKTSFLLLFCPTWARQTFDNLFNN